MVSIVTYVTGFAGVTRRTVTREVVDKVGAVSAVAGRVGAVVNIWQTKQVE